MEARNTITLKDGTPLPSKEIGNWTWQMSQIYPDYQIVKDPHRPVNTTCFCHHQGTGVFLGNSTCMSTQAATIIGPPWPVIGTYFVCGSWPYPRLPGMPPADVGNLGTAKRTPSLHRVLLCCICGPTYEKHEPVAPAHGDFQAKPNEGRAICYDPLPVLWWYNSVTGIDDYGLRFRDTC